MLYSLFEGGGEKQKSSPIVFGMLLSIIDISVSEFVFEKLKF